MSAVDEDALIKSRPLTVEERPFKRIHKRCLTLPTLFPPASPSSTTPSSTPSTPDSLDKFRSDIAHDFTLFEITLARLQLLLSTNTSEIARYTSEKSHITCLISTARAEMQSLRDSLVDAQREKEDRLAYDRIAGEILATRALRVGREEQVGNLERLRAEIEELEGEGRRYGEVWMARREQFGGIVGMLEALQGQIREDKEEHDRREGMDEEEGEEGEEIEHPSSTGGGGASAGGRLATGNGNGGDRSGAATPSALSTVPSAGQTPLRMVRDVGMADTPSVKDEDRMDTS